MSNFWICTPTLVGSGSSSGCSVCAAVSANHATSMARTKAIWIQAVREPGRVTMASSCVTCLAHGIDDVADLVAQQREQLVAHVVEIGFEHEVGRARMRAVDGDGGLHLAGTR